VQVEPEVCLEVFEALLHRREVGVGGDGHHSLEAEQFVAGERSGGSVGVHITDTDVEVCQDVCQAGCDSRLVRTL
jgi:hypothetical protein